MNKDIIYNPDISSVKESENYKREEAAKKENLTPWQRFVGFFTNGRTRFALGIIFLLFGIYLLIAFLSFIFGAGAQDQNRELYYSTMENAHNPEQIHNAVGALGAKVSQFSLPTVLALPHSSLCCGRLPLASGCLKRAARSIFIPTPSCACSAFSLSRS